MNALHHRICDLLTTRFGVQSTTMRPDSTLGELHLDSLALAEFTEVLQTEFDLPMSDDDISQESSIEDVAALLAAMGATR